MKRNEMKPESAAILFARKEALDGFDAHAMKRMVDGWGIPFATHKDIGLVSVYGGLGNAVRDSWFSTYADIRTAVEALRKDNSIKGVLVAVNSPGGMAMGLIETCAMIRELASVKPVYAYIDGMACSAAFAIAVACSRVYIGPGGETGCCGCYSEPLEWSDEAYKSFGLLHRIFRSANAPKKNLSVITDEQAAKEYQALIDDHGDKYLEMVASYRGVEKETAEKSFGQGAVVTAAYAFENKMVDEISSMDKCLSDLLEAVAENKSQGSVNKTETESSHTSAESTGGEKVTIEDFNKLSEEDQKTFVSDLLGSHPSLFAEREEATRKAERDRISGLEALRDGSDAVNKLVDAAVEDGRKTANDIAPEVVKAMKSAVKTSANDENAALRMLGILSEADDQVNVPAMKGDEEFEKAVVADEE